jgi:hypothetical protein
VAAGQPSPERPSLLMKKVKGPAKRSLDGARSTSGSLPPDRVIRFFSPALNSARYILASQQRFIVGAVSPAMVSSQLETTLPAARYRQIGRRDEVAYSPLTLRSNSVVLFFRVRRRW